MPKVADPTKQLNAETLQKIEELEKRCNEILDELFCLPEDEKFKKLSRELSELEIKILTLSREKPIDYILDIK